MIHLIDGPAAGVWLSPQRTPILLRIVHGPAGWDCLDQLRDFAIPDEAIDVYEQWGPVTTAHVTRSDAQGRRCGSFETNTTYRLFRLQPGDPHTRDNATWSRWCASIRDEVLAARQQEQAAETGEAST